MKYNILHYIGKAAVKVLNVNSARSSGYRANQDFDRENSLSNRESHSGSSRGSNRERERENTSRGSERVERNRENNSRGSDKDRENNTSSDNSRGSNKDDDRDRSSSSNNRERDKDREREDHRLSSPSKGIGEGTTSRLHSHIRKDPPTTLSTSQANLRSGGNNHGSSMRDNSSPTTAREARSTALIFPPYRDEYDEEEIETLNISNESVTVLSSGEHRISRRNEEKEGEREIERRAMRRGADNQPLEFQAPKQLREIHHSTSNGDSDMHNESEVSHSNKGNHDKDKNGQCRYDITSSNKIEQPR